MKPRMANARHAGHQCVDGNKDVRAHVPRRGIRGITSPSIGGWSRSRFSGSQPDSVGSSREIYGSSLRGIVDLAESLINWEPLGSLIVGGLLIKWELLRPIVVPWQGFREREPAIPESREERLSFSYRPHSREKPRLGYILYVHLYVCSSELLRTIRIHTRVYVY